MQTFSHQHPNTLDQQSRRIAVIAILLFAFSGLISGFAVGAFVRPNLGAGTTSHTGSARTPVPQITNALNFAPGVSQIQPTDANGQVMWNYTVGTFVDPGTYYLVVLMDWQGQSFDWSWRLVAISR